MYDIERYARDNTPLIIIGNKIDAIDENASDKIVSDQDEMLIYGYIRQYVINEYDLNFPPYLIDICIAYWPGPKQRISTDTQLSYNDAKSYADKYNIKYIETSCKTGENVDKVFYTLTTDTLINISFDKGNRWQSNR